MEFYFVFSVGILMAGNHNFCKNDYLSVVSFFEHKGRNLKYFFFLLTFRI